ncbi:cell wall-binding repeat-containing protein [Metaclostridioides mangenotii]|uniref:cell wall-binding repeat-containing protein n=1 Tax=Metaclostridioides mangenotii TaxID=1540 RepID=UPI0004867146|nr:cell wall-binding repeat-containing protein [Clostridioides mangenotii]
MSKKRNLAVVMAAATVATSVAPVFADTAKSLDGETISAKDSTKMSELKNEVEGYLDTRYVNDEDELNTPGLAGKSVYTVTADVTDIKNQSALTGLDIKDENSKKIATIAKIRDFEKVVNALDTDADTFSLSVVDKIGHTKVDDKIVDYTVEKYDTAEMTELNTKIDAIKALHFDAKGDLKQIKEDGAKALFKTVDTGVESGKDYILLTLNNSGNKTIKIKKDELKTLVTDGANLKVDIDFKEDSNKNKLDANGKIVTNPDDFVIEGLKYSKSNIDDDDKEDPKEFTIVNKDVAENVNANTLYNKDLKKLTKEGNEIAKFIKEYHDSTKPGGYVGGTLTPSELRLNVPTEKSDVKSLFTNLTIKGTSSELNSLAKVFKDNGATISDDLSGVKGLDINTLAGLNREATAIEISKQNRKDNAATAENVVLVSGYAIADGLSATPFAKANNASILFAGTDKISEDTMDEIQALGGKVFIVGGTSSVSKDVEKQLDNKFISFERISGSDRMETSLKVAKKMNAVDGVFVAGGRAEADAMSVSGIAAKEKSPILLTDDNGLTADQESWLKRQENVSDAYIAGGNNSVPTSVETQLRKITSKVKRLAGDNRQGTNAKVINEFYKTSAFTKVYVAKSDNNGLVDALPAGAIAGVNPVVLATDELNSEQISALKSLNNKVGTLDNNKYQIGYGIADKVWDAINDID